MTNEDLFRHIGVTAIVAATLATSVYLTMVNVTLAHLEVVSGQMPFDMRPFGYSPTDAAALLDALRPDGHAYYLTRQIPLDILYPALLALTLGSTILWFGKRLPNRRLVHFGIAVLVGAALFDYIENLGIVVMILSWPSLPDALVHATSAATIAKSVLTTVAVMLVLLVGLLCLRLPKTDLRT